MSELILWMKIVLFLNTFVLTYLTLCHMEYKMWEDWFKGKRSWWNILYKNR